MFSFDFDPSLGVLRAHITGNWTVDVVDDYLRELLANAHDVRRATGKLRLLVDVEHSILPPDVLERLRVVERSVLQTPDDRIAILLKSSLGKAQLKSVSATDQVASFLSPNAARTWLLAYD